jgi:hypothetical protein
MLLLHPFGTRRAPTDMSLYHGPMNGVVSYDDLLTVVRAMDGFPAPWFVSGGWALDLYRGEVTRQHADIELGVARADQRAIVQHFPDRGRYKGVNHTWEPWNADDVLELPDFQILVGEPETPGEFEFFLNEIHDGRWFFRRDQSIGGPLEELTTVSPSGIPVLAPEIQLLYKSGTPRPKDEADFAGILPMLESRRVARLLELLMAYRPEHPWLEMLHERLADTAS